MGLKLTKPLNLPGRISIGRIYGGGEENEIRVEIEDEVSHTLVLEFKLTLEDYAKLLTGLSHVPGRMNWYGGERVGWKHEVKSVIVPFKTDGIADWYRMTDEERHAQPSVKAALAPFEVDGWIARVDDLFNSKRTVRDKISNRERVGQTVSFVRWLKPEEPVT